MWREDYRELTLARPADWGGGSRRGSFAPSGLLMVSRDISGFRDRRMHWHRVGGCRHTSCTGPSPHDEERPVQSVSSGKVENPGLEQGQLRGAARKSPRAGAELKDGSPGQGPAVAQREARSTSGWLLTLPALLDLPR